MRLETVIFDSGTRNPGYERLLDVLSRSAAINSPNTPLTVTRVTDSDDDLAAIGARRKQRFTDNARKTRHHRLAVERASLGETLCLLDADMMVLGDASPLGDTGADVTYTARPAGSQYVFNSGVICLRISPVVKEFYRRWEAAATQMLADEALHRKYHPTYGGVNQCGMAYVREQWVDCPLSFTSVECREWNCEQDSWDSSGPHTKIVHVLGHLRRVVLDDEPPQSHGIDQLAAQWRRYCSDGHAVG